MSTKIVTVSNAVTWTSSTEKSCRPRSKAVTGGRPPSCRAMDPSTVEAPVRTTMPRPAPARTSVPMNAHDGSSSECSAPVIAAAVFSAGSDSPVSTASSHSSPSASSKRTSAGTMTPVSSTTTSPGTNAATGRCSERPSLTTTAVWLTRECRSSMARSDRYSLNAPRPTESATMPRMMAASVRSPNAIERAAANASSKSIGLRNCRPNVTSRFAPLVRSALGPASWRRAPASISLSPSAPLCSCATTAAGCIVADRASVRPCHGALFAIRFTGPPA